MDKILLILMIVLILQRTVVSKRRSYETAQGVLVRICVSSKMQSSVVV